jgi:hypothetical protein
MPGRGRALDFVVMGGPSKTRVQCLACGLNTVTVDAQSLPVGLVPEQSWDSAVREHMVEDGSDLNLAHGAHRVTREEPVALAEEAWRVA